MDKYVQHRLTTKRLKITYYRSGEGRFKKLLLLHGNLSSSLFFLPLLPELSQWFDVAIPDLRCFGDTEDKPVDATRGYRDWSDDIVSFIDKLGWDTCSIVGWSLGGNIAMQYAIDYSERLEKLILLAPGSPYGFGGTSDVKGSLLQPPGLGSGGGCANPYFLMALSSKSELALRGILNSFYFTPEFNLDPDLELLLMSGIAKTKLGERRYPGDYRYVLKWPFVAAGMHGILNCMAPSHGNLSKLIEIEKKPRILWIRGQGDVIISNQSILDFGYLGSIGMIPGWPGEDGYPIQPMVDQTRYFLECYKEKGGEYQELVIPGGHACHLEARGYFISALYSFIAAPSN